MTSPLSTATTLPALSARLQRMKRSAALRDQNMRVLKDVREGKSHELFPDLFNAQWPKSVVANWIDSVAREFAEMIAPLPALNCSSRAMATDADKRRAAKKNQIGTHYWKQSQLARHMISHADKFLSYGFAPFVAEPDYRLGMPMIRLEDPIGAYYENDRYGTTLRYAKCFNETAAALAAMFPEHAHRIMHKLQPGGGQIEVAADSLVEVVRYVDCDDWIMFLPDRDDLVLSRTKNLLDCCPVAVAERPGLTVGEGQYDQVVWVQMARHRMALLGLEAGVKAVGAPLAVPRDVVEMAVGPDAVIQTDQPDKVRRVGIEVPQSTFALQEVLEGEMRMGARYPEGRAGGIDASVITGRGVQALMGSFDTQISTAQTVLGWALARVTSFCFELDVKVWPTATKTITGTMAGEPYELTYVPEKAIGENYSCDVSYGYAAGLAPNQAVVMLLQLRGDGLIDRDSVRRQLPFDINVDQMQRNLDVEQTSDALKQGLFALLGGIAPMAAQGMDPKPYFRAAASIIAGRQNGKPLEQLFIDAFGTEVMDPEAAKREAELAEQQESGAPADTGGSAGAQASMPPEVAPGQAGMAPGGQPDLQMLVAGLRNGKPQLDAQVSRRLPVA